jgi:hypothetical protein
VPRAVHVPSPAFEYLARPAESSARYAVSRPSTSVLRSSRRKPYGLVPVGANSVVAVLAVVGRPVPTELTPVNGADALPTWSCPAAMPTVRAFEGAAAICVVVVAPEVAKRTPPVEPAVQ